MTFDSKFVEALEDFKGPSQWHKIGNDALYRLCNETNYNDPDSLAAKLWLIGRSYAASPERRKTDNPGTGTGEFFKKVADALVEDFSKIAGTLLSFKQGYAFCDNQGDADAFWAAIEAVNCLNERLSDIVSNLNEQLPAIVSRHDAFNDEEENTRNNISFCSKFLHFHFPHLVFIKDQYSAKGSSILLNPRSCTSGMLRNYSIPKAFGKQLQKTECVNELPISVSNVSEKIQNVSEKIQKEYIPHCQRSYQLAYLVHNSIQPKDYWPRFTDRVFMNIKAEKKEKVQ